MKKLCKNCSCWVRRGNSDAYGKCKSEKFLYQETDEDSKKDELIYWDYESYSAGFKTGENFGCIHFVKKEQEAESVQQS